MRAHAPSRPGGECQPGRVSYVGVLETKAEKSRPRTGRAGQSAWLLEGEVVGACGSVWCARCKCFGVVILISAPVGVR
jgi:hypothetical protein